MVKHLQHLSTAVKLMMLGALLCAIWGAIWLRSDVRSFDFAKPWILSQMNPEDTSYAIDFEKVEIDWRDMAKLGKLKITNITLTNRQGLTFVRLPAVYATIDPIGFMPGRHMFRTVILRAPNLSMNRTMEGAVQVGIQGAESPFDLNTLLPSTGEEASQEPVKLPFRYFMIERAGVKFHDEKTNSDIVSENMSLRLGHSGGSYRATFNAPFSYDGKPGSISGTLLPNKNATDYKLSFFVKQLPAKLVCAFAPCPEQAVFDGTLNGEVRLGISEDGVIRTLWAHVASTRMLLTAPSWFEKPVRLLTTDITASYDLLKKAAVLHNALLGLEDTSIRAAATANEKPDGWYAEITADVAKVDVTKVSKYWPIALAPETRLWITSKLKAGAALATVKLHLDPEAIAADDLPDRALEADMKAYGVTVDYLPGFPEMKNIDADIHFTGITVKVDGRNGTALSATKASKLVVWCPDLLHPNTPMEITMTADMPASDVAKILNIEQLTFDDDLGLDPSKVTGAFNTTMKLKFNAFSDQPSGGAGGVNLDAVDYDIKGRVENFAQAGVAGGYDVRALTGDFIANMKSSEFNGALTLGDTGTSDVTLVDAADKPLQVTVKSRHEVGKSSNDFSLTYKPGEDAPHVVISGKRLDGSVAYGGSKNSLLKDFPAIHLNIDLEELLLAPGLPFTNVKGNLNCSKDRCESAHFDAMRGKAVVKADITRNKGVRQLMLTASDAGDFLKGLDITDRMTKGTLELSGSYNDTKFPLPFNGRLIINEFTLKNSEILGRILSIGSLTGLANALTGSGILFNKLSANIEQSAGVVTLSEGRANGTAMGITVEGTVDTNTTDLSLKGVVVPAYLLNSLLGNIPIIGELAGGEGEGLIAINYAVKGTYDDPKVSVNPLSALTPGFLRGIFGGGDKPVTKPGSAEQGADKPMEMRKNQP